MEIRTSNMVFLTGIFAGLAAMLVLSPNTHASEVAQDDTICTEHLCVKSISAPLLVLDSRTEPHGGPDARIDVRKATYSTERRLPTFEAPTALPDTVTRLGKITKDTTAPADSYLGSTSAHMPRHNSTLEPVSSVTGLGLISTF